MYPELIGQHLTLSKWSTLGSESYIVLLLVVLPTIAPQPILDSRHLTAGLAAQRICRDCMWLQTYDVAHRENSRRQDETCPCRQLRSLSLLHNTPRYPLPTDEPANGHCHSSVTCCNTTAHRWHYCCRILLRHVRACWITHRASTREPSREHEYRIDILASTFSAIVAIDFAISTTKHNRRYGNRICKTSTASA